jgi:cytoplasmic iron level regulating protein YaaA (DUF328/UPF0246 family)
MNTSATNKISCIIKGSEPVENKTAIEIATYLKKQNLKQLGKILSCSDKKTEEAFNYYKNFTTNKLAHAALAFNGTAFSKLSAKTFTEDDWEFAQEHLIIFSALYGILKPADYISQYRLDLNNSLKWENVSLKKFWKDKLNNFFMGKARENTPFINLASAEYSALLPESSKIITPEFITIKKGKESKSSVYSKQARGLFARYIIKNRITNFNILRNTQVEEYIYNSEQSTDDRPVFIRHI